MPTGKWSCLKINTGFCCLQASWAAWICLFCTVIWLHILNCFVCAKKQITNSTGRANTLTGIHKYLVIVLFSNRLQLSGLSNCTFAYYNSKYFAFLHEIASILKEIGLQISAVSWFVPHLFHVLFSEKKWQSS